MAVMTAAALLATGCAAGDPAPGDPTPSAPASPSTSESSSPSATVRSSAPARLIVYGDSNSTGFKGTLESGMAAGHAWPALLPVEAWQTVGGWAVDGATTTAMADNAVPAEADVLVIMGGTNDLAQGGTAQQVEANAVRIADTVGAPRVVLAAIAPFEYSASEVVAFNQELAAFASQRGWIFVDPWVDVRTPEGTWVADYLTDGVHTSPEGYARAAAQIDAQLRSATQ